MLLHTPSWIEKFLMLVLLLNQNLIRILLNSLFQGARVLLLMSHRQKRKVHSLLLCAFLIVLTIGQKRNHSTGDELLLLEFKKHCIKFRNCFVDLFCN